MTKEQEDAIKFLELHTNFMGKLDKGRCIRIPEENFTKTKESIKTVLNMLKEKEAEIEKKDNAVKRIINRLDNDIKRITESKTEKYCDDYRRCRLKAYRTKTREIKKYIKKQYFERKVKNE